MADEITVNVGFRATKGSIDVQRFVPSQQIDMAGDAWSGGVQSIPTTSAGTAVTIASAVGTPGWAMFTNLDETNYIELGRQVAGSFYPVARLNAGESCVLRLGTASNELYARANTAAVLLDSMIVEA